jgi:MoaA/NifB/PqqE/SkfB family radical SAM enzyme
MQITSVDSVVIEITRRCNMCCAHCLRGDAEAVDIQEKYIDAFLDSFANA